MRAGQGLVLSCSDPQIGLLFSRKEIIIFALQSVPHFKNSYAFLHENFKYVNFYKLKFDLQIFLIFLDISFQINLDKCNFKNGK